MLGGCILLIASGSLILSRPSSVDREHTHTTKRRHKFILIFLIQIDFGRVFF